MARYTDAMKLIRNSGESFYAYFIEDAGVANSTSEEITVPIPRPTIVDRGRFREAVGSQILGDGYPTIGPSGDTSSTSDRDGAPSPVAGKPHPGDKRVRNRISQVILDASKRSKRRMTSCTIQ